MICSCHAQHAFNYTRTIGQEHLLVVYIVKYHINLFVCIGNG